MMKTLINIKYITASLAVLLLFFTSCEEDNNITPLESFNLSEAVITAPVEDFSLALERSNRQDVLRFEWEAAMSTADFTVTYTFQLDRSEGDFSTPLLEQETTSEGEDTFLELPFSTLDAVLAEAGIAPNEAAPLKWRVEARSINQVSISDTGITLQRFDIPGPPETLFLAGAATEAGANVSNALGMHRLLNVDGSPTNTFELYTALESGLSYNFYTNTSSQAIVYSASGTTLEIDDTPIIAPESAVYRVTVNFDAETVTLFKIDKWSIVGNVIPDQWEGDQALEYQGNGVWEATIELLDFNPQEADERFIFRANEDWGQVLKNKPGTIDEVAFEATAGDFGFEDGLNDILVTELGFQRITLRLNGDGYRYSIAPDVAPEPNPDATIQDTPENLFISGSATEAGAERSNALAMYRLRRADGTLTETFEIYTTLNQGASYNFYNSNTNDPIVYTLNNGILELGDAEIVTTQETAVYRVTVDFQTATVSTLKIDKWSIVGNVITNGWGGDEALDYQGNGVWRSTLMLIDADSADANKRFVFRANGDWGIVYKEIPETTAQELAFENTAEKLGFESLNDIPVAQLGTATITLTLNGSGYSYTIE